MGNFAGKKVLKYCHYFTKNFLGPMSELGGRGRGSRPFSPSRWCSTVTKEGKKIEGRAINLISIILRDGQGVFFF